MASYHHSRREVRKADLTPERQHLLAEMQRINFGRIEGLTIHQGQLIFGPHTKIIRKIKFGGENNSRPEMTVEDFALKGEVIELFETFDRLDDGEVSIDVRYGLPFEMEVKETVRA